MKIGILTHYFNSKNYGGLLQAYALVQFLKLNQNVFQTYVSSNKNEIKEKSLIEKIFTYGVKGFILSFNYRYSNVQLKINKADVIYREKIFSEFEKKIPHFMGQNEEELIRKFDIFISGSDQVWNPNWFSKHYFLDFVNSNKLKISYAASMGVDSLTKEQSNKIIPLIEKFDYVSVREKSAQRLINQYTDKEVLVVCDPVLLLNKENWNEIATSPLKNTDYIYSYFLGDRKDNRDIAKNISKKFDFPIAGVPYVKLSYNSYDKKYLDIKVNDVAPPEFLGLIRDSQCVVTDSFHATVFSIIFQKKFFAFLRNKPNDQGSMNSRITDLLEEVGLTDRIITDKLQITEEFLSKEIDFTYAKKVVKEKRIYSVDFLKKAFTGTEMEQPLAEYIKKIKEEINEN